jgi:hypothetical protein
MLPDTELRLDRLHADLDRTSRCLKSLIQGESKHPLFTQDGKHLVISPLASRIARDAIEILSLKLQPFLAVYP